MPAFINVWPEGVIYPVMACAECGVLVELLDVQAMMDHKCEEKRDADGSEADENRRERI